MDNKELIKLAYDMGAHPYRVGGMVAALQKGIEIGKAEQQAIDEDHLREVKKMAIDKGWQWMVDWVFENAPHEVFDELMSSREEYVKAMEGE